MNCLEFRRHCLAEPGSQDAQFLRHQSECSNCAAFASRVSLSDKQISEALTVDVPENLASRIILKQSLADKPQRQRRTYALAAGVVLLLGLAGGIYTALRTEPFERALTAHLDSEWNILTKEFNATDKELAQVLRGVGGKLKGDIGEIRHVSLCNFTKEGGAHLVLQGRYAPVVILLLPKTRTRTSEVVSTERFDGMIVPITNGVMVVAGDQKENLHEMAERVRAAVVWRL